MSIDATLTIAGIVTAHPMAANVLLQYGLDGADLGGLSLSAACERLNVELEALRAELDGAVRRSLPDDRDWAGAPTLELIEHLLDRYHEGGYALMDQIGLLMRQAVHEHTGRWGDLLPKLAELWFHMAPELTGHFRKEEMMLFPMMRFFDPGDQIPPFEGPLQQMFVEHDEAIAALNAIKDHTRGFWAPYGADRTVTQLWETLKRFDAETRRHIHLENDVLFPRFQTTGPQRGAASPSKHR